MPYDFNRVRLQTPIHGIDYINASHITGIKSDLHPNRESRFGDMSFKISQTKKSSDTSVDIARLADPARFSNINFIASQGPLSNTCAHHLQMIFENNIDIVIMLTNVSEDNKGGHNIY